MKSTYEIVRHADDIKDAQSWKEKVVGAKFEIILLKKGKKFTRII